MVDPIRVLALGAFFGSMVAWSLVSPKQMSAVAEEPVRVVATAIEDLFPDTVDPKIFRKYDITFDESISTDVSRTQVVTKIGGGRASEVTIVTTPSGTYSTDGVLSPNVRYPGIEKRSKGWGDGYWDSVMQPDGGGHWISFSQGSFTYLVFREVAART
jgi:hypothetical protein